MKFEREFTDDEVKILKHDLLDIPAWINGMIDGKISNGVKRAAMEFKSKLVETKGSIPADSKDAALAYFQLPDYKNRQDRENERRDFDVATRT